MGKNSGIEWTEHTFNPWWGCDKVSPACKNCYAEAFAYRIGFNGRPRVAAPGSRPKPSLPLLWGPSGQRRFFGDDHWAEPLRWQAEAQAAGQRARVFCASMADVAEDRRELASPRQRLGQLILATDALDWLLLTKRQDNIEGMRRELWPGRPDRWWPSNVWMGVTAEDDEHAQLRIPRLLECGAHTLFVSYEPALGLIHWRPEWLRERSEWSDLQDRLDWIIVGGESGHGARDFNLVCARRTIDACRGTDVSVFVKQLGAKPMEIVDSRGPDGRGTIATQHLRILDERGNHDGHGKNRAYWPHDVDVRQVPHGYDRRPAP